jgi:septum formation protein
MPRLHLASQSPRRRQLLTQHGLEHDAEHPGVDDGVLEPGQVTPRQWAASLAYFKAAAGAERARQQNPGVLFLGADTICVKEGQIIGQARDEADAQRTLRTLENGEHEVITGVALLWGGGPDSPTSDVARPEYRAQRRVFVDRARVRVGEIGSGRIRDYVASGQWRGKAGAYNLTERLEAGWPIEYDGDPTTIMGLPMLALVRELERWRGEAARGEGA